LKNPLRKKVS